MVDINMAQKLLKEENLRLVIVKNGQVLFKSKDRGIKPMYMAVTKKGQELKGAVVADKVIGRAAAMLCKYIDVTEIYADLISQNAVDVLEKESKINISYKTLVPFIKNREYTDMCPIEKLSLKVANVEELIIGIKEFLNTRY